MFTLTLFQQYAHPDMQEIAPVFVSNDAEFIATMAVKFVEACVEKPDETLPIATKLQWVGSFAMQAPSVRIHTVSREQKYERWGKEIKNLPVMLIQGVQDRCSEADKLVEIAREWLGSFELKMMKGVGHTPAYERPQKVNKYILDFVYNTVLSRTPQ